MTLVGGDGNAIQICKIFRIKNRVTDSVWHFADFVGFSPSQNSIIVAHEGTDPTQLWVARSWTVSFIDIKHIIYHSMSDLTDINILMGALDTTLFPGVSSSIQVHEGFRDEHALTASTILAEVKRLMSVKKTKNVTIVRSSISDNVVYWLGDGSIIGGTFTGRSTFWAWLIVLDTEYPYCIHQSCHVRHTPSGKPGLCSTYRRKSSQL